MKSRSIQYSTLVVLLVALACFVTYQARHNSRRVNSTSTSQKGTIQTEVAQQEVAANPTNDKPQPSAQKISRDERLSWLEKQGEVPEGASVSDWQLAQNTTWWGKPLAPREFWSGRIVWLDKSATEAANRKGRGYPPMPFEDPSLPHYPDDDGIRSEMHEVEGPNLHFAGSSKERAFWDKFVRTHPHPPEDLQREQSQIADAVLTSQNAYQQGGDGAQAAADRLTARKSVVKQRAEQLGCPREALTDEALFWAYVLQKREEYGRQIARLVGLNDYVVSNWTARLAVDPNFVTNSLTHEQLKAANAWKLAYLQRLRREQVDESYINAYLKAWYLSEAEVFGEP